MAGQWFLADYGLLENPVPRGRPITPDGRIYRLAADGTLQPVAEGFVNPIGLSFVGGNLWVAEMNGDFLMGRGAPDGFIAEISARSSNR